MSKKINPIKWELQAIDNYFAITDENLNTVCKIEKVIDPITEKDLTIRNGLFIEAAPEMMNLLSETLLRFDAVLLLDELEAKKVIGLKNKIFNLLQTLKTVPINF